MTTEFDHPENRPGSRPGARRPSGEVRPNWPIKDMRLGPPPVPMPASV